MDSVGQYITTFVSNMTHSPETTPTCAATRSSHCNTLLCTVPGTSKVYNHTFLPCNNPVGLFLHYHSPEDSLETQLTSYDPVITVNTSANSEVVIILNQTGAGEVGFAVSSKLKC